MPARTTIEKRLTRLESFWSERREQVYRERLHECSVKLTQAERRARIVLLARRRMQADSIAPTCCEALEDAAVRAFAAIWPPTGLLMITLKPAEAIVRMRKR
jgi:hypothetical protein